MPSTQEKLYKGKYEIALYEFDVYTFEEGCLLTTVNNIKGLLIYFGIPITHQKECEMSMKINRSLHQNKNRKILVIKGEVFKISLITNSKKKKGGSKNRN